MAALITYPSMTQRLSYILHIEGTYRWAYGVKRLIIDRLFAEAFPHDEASACRFMAANELLIETGSKTLELRNIRAKCLASNAEFLSDAYAVFKKSWVPAYGSDEERTVFVNIFSLLKRLLGTAVLQNPDPEAKVPEMIERHHKAFEILTPARYLAKKKALFTAIQRCRNEILLASAKGVRPFLRFQIEDTE